MLIAQDKSRQKSGKSYGTDYYQKLDTSKELFPEPKEIWQLRPIFEERNSVSECDREGIEEDMSCKKSHLKCNEMKLRGEQSFPGKNVLFDPGKCSSISDSSIENDYSDVEVACAERGLCAQHNCDKRCYSPAFDKETQAERKGLYSIERDVAGERCEDCHFRKCHDRRRTKGGTMVYGQAVKSRQECKESQKKTGKDDFEGPNLKVRRMPTKIRHSHTKDCCDAFWEQRCENLHDRVYTRGKFSYKGECKGKRHFCRDWCNSCTGVELRAGCEKRNQKLNQSTHLLRESKTYKCLQHTKSAEADYKEEESLNESEYLSKGLIRHLPKAQQDRYHQSKDTDEMFTRKLKKVVDSCEELPVVNESPEHLSDGTYNVSLNKFSNLNNSGDSLTNFPRGNEKMKDVLDGGSSWFLYKDNMSRDTLSETLPYKIIPERTIKTRSRRTRINRCRRSRWMKAYIHAVMEKSHNEMVGLMVLGPRGPEFFSKTLRKNGCYIPFRKSRSFPEGPTKSCEMSLCFEPKNILCKSDPERKPSFPSNELISPEEDIKTEEKVTNFDKNVNEIVKNTESPARDQYQNHSLTKVNNNDATNVKDKTETKQLQNEEDLKKVKHPSCHRIPFEFLSEMVPKSMGKNEKPIQRDVFAFNMESKTISENLNEQAKQFTHLKEKEENSSKLEKEFPANVAENANFSLWNMRIGDAVANDLREMENTAGKEDVTQNHDIGDHKRNQCKLHSKDIIFVDEKIKDSPTDSDKRSEKIDALMKKKHVEESTKSNGIQAFCRKDDVRIPLKHSERCHDVKVSSKESNTETEQIVQNQFKDLVGNACTLSEKKSENHQKTLKEMRYEAKMNGLEVSGSTTSDEQIKTRETKEEQSWCFSKVQNQKSEEADSRKEISEYFTNKCKNRHANCANHRKKEVEDVGSGYHSDGIRKKGRKPRRGRDEMSQIKFFKKLQNKQRDIMNKKQCLSCMTFEDKAKLLREALPSMAAENEATHLKQLKKYIYHFIDKVELKESSSTEVKNKKEAKSKSKESTSSESSEVSMEAMKILNFVNDPFKRITSDITIDIAKLTNALTREGSSKSPRNFPTSLKNHKNHGEGTEEDSSLPCPNITSSDCGDEVEPTYLKQLKKIRNDHLGNIITEVRKLSELLRFLDRCNRLKL